MIKFCMECVLFVSFRGHTNFNFEFCNRCLSWVIYTSMMGKARGDVNKGLFGMPGVYPTCK